MNRRVPFHVFEGMCAAWHSEAVARLVPGVMGHSRINRLVLSGLAVAFVGLAAFGLAHAIIIAPIWTQLLGGVPFAAAAGFSLAWAFDLSRRSLEGAKADTLSDARRTQSIGSGVQFGAVMFLTLVPAAGLDVAFRANGIRVPEWIEIASTIGLAILSGSVAGWLLTRRRDASFAFAVAAVALTFASAGPLPVAQSARGAWLSFSIAPICLVSGAALAFLHTRLHPRSTL